MTGAARGEGSTRIPRRARCRAPGSLKSPACKQHRKGNQEREAAAEQGETAVGRALRQLAKHLVVFPALRKKSGDGGELCLLLERAHRCFVYRDKAGVASHQTVRRGELDDLGPHLAFPGGVALQGDARFPAAPVALAADENCSVELVESGSDYHRLAGVEIGDASRPRLDLKPLGPLHLESLQ